MKDDDSVLKQFYPNEFEVDPYGSQYESEYLVLIPFMDQKLLLEAYDSLDLSQLTESEQNRNIHRLSQIMIRDESQ